MEGEKLERIELRDSLTAQGLILTTLALMSLGVVMVFSACLLYTSPSPRDRTRSRMPSSA